MSEVLQVSVLESVQELLQPGMDLNDTTIDMYCRQLKDIHMDLGVEYANCAGCMKRSDVFLRAMTICADLYQTLDTIRREQVEYYEGHASGEADE